MNTNKVIVSKVAIDDLVATCLMLEELLAKIRYCNWPTIGLGIGLNAEELDEAIFKSQESIRRVKRQMQKQEQINGFMGR